MKKLNFIEVISNIKVGQEYINNYKTIKRDKNGITIIHNIKTKMTNRMAFDNETLFVLKRKEVTFQEALLAYNRGLEIESGYSNYKFKRAVPNKHLYFSKILKCWETNENGFSTEEVFGNWYIND